MAKSTQAKCLMSIDPWLFPLVLQFFMVLVVLRWFVAFGEFGIRSIHVAWNLVRVTSRVGIMLNMQVVALLSEGRREPLFGLHVIEDARSQKVSPFTVVNYSTLGYLDGARGDCFSEMWLSFMTPRKH
ncbi:hypothetical protein ISN45_At03g031420 [Arabidopsis thaliana x Arabidopsis arenosa]|uniref:Transmembrane protein n=1 Tax=Arabidopsis thaliana x Arabidopsis arenosa TaxID=1240361 RepID=A0A8T2EST4_9BRAS|nr:hypothetical protein ISN45_At03g031420 [Arabidopsis thaliana x Arabidopsis arenosa]